MIEFENVLDSVKLRRLLISIINHIIEPFPKKLILVY